MATPGNDFDVLAQETLGQLILTIKTSKDKMSLFVDCDFDSTKDKVEIDKSGIYFLLKGKIKEDRVRPASVEALMPLLKAGKAIRDRRLAQGKEPTPGEDGRFLPIVKMVEPPARPEDLRYVRDLQKVVPGMILGIVVPPQVGQEGEDAFGSPVPALVGSPIKIKVDASIVVKSSIKEGGSDYLIARTAGYFCKDGEQYKVKPSIEVPGEIDRTVSKLDFTGKIKVSQDIAKGISIVAWDDISIGGRTHGGSLESTKGSIKVDGLVLGGPGISVSTGTSFSAGLILNLKASSGGDISVIKEARDSNLEALGKIESKRGHLFGGQALCLGGMEVGILGSEGASLTIVGSKTKAQVEAELAKYQEKLAELSTQDQTLTAQMAPLGLDKEKMPPLDGTMCRKINDLVLRLADIRVAKDLLMLKSQRMKDALARPVWFQLNYMERIHKGVVIKIGEDQMVIDSDRSGPGTIEYGRDGGKFVDCPKAKKLFA